MSVSIFHLIILKKLELNPIFSSLKANFATPDKKRTVILWQLLYRDCYNIGHANKAQAKLGLTPPRNTESEHCVVCW